MGHTQHTYNTEIWGSQYVHAESMAARSATSRRTAVSLPNARTRTATAHAAPNKLAASPMATGTPCPSFRSGTLKGVHAMEATRTGATAESTTTWVDLGLDPASNGATPTAITSW